MWPFQVPTVLLFQVMLQAHEATKSRWAKPSYGAQCRPRYVFGMSLDCVDPADWPSLVIDSVQSGGFSARATPAAEPTDFEADPAQHVGVEQVAGVDHDAAFD